MKKMLLGFVFLCGMSATALAQDDFAIEQGFSPGLEPAPYLSSVYIGVTSGYGITFLPGGIENPFLKDRDFKNVLVNTLTLGVNGEFFLRNKYRNEAINSLIFKILYRNYFSFNNSFSQTEEKLAGTQTQLVETQYSTTYNTSSISFETLYSLSLYSSPFSVIAGPGFGFIVDQELLKRAEIIQPSDFTFNENSFDGDYSLEQNGRAAVFKSGNASMLQVYVKAGFQYTMFFGKRDQFQLVPSASADFGITRSYSKEKFRLITTDIGLDFRAAL